jgi:hypothetical protein
VADLFDKESQQVVPVPDEQVADALRSEKYNLPQELVTDDNHVLMISPSGNARSIPMNQLWESLDKKYKLETIAQKGQRGIEQTVDGPVGALSATALGAIKGATIVGAEPLLVGAGVDPEMLRALQDVHSGKYMASEIGGSFLGLGKAKLPVQMLAKAARGSSKKVSAEIARRMLSSGSSANKGINLLKGVKTLPKGQERRRRAMLKLGELGVEAAIDGAGFATGQYINDAFVGRVDFTGQTLAENAWDLTKYVGTGALLGGTVGGLLGAASVPLKSGMRKAGVAGAKVGSLMGPAVLSDAQALARIRNADNPAEAAIEELIGHHSLQSLGASHKSLIKQLKGTFVTDPHAPKGSRRINRYEAAKKWLREARIQDENGQMVPIIDGATSLEDLAERLNRAAEAEGSFLKDKVYPWLDRFGMSGENKDVWVGVNPVRVVRELEELAKSLNREADLPQRDLVLRHAEALKQRLMNEAGIPEKVRDPKHTAIPIDRAKQYELPLAVQGKNPQTELRTTYRTRPRDFELDYVNRTGPDGGPKKGTLSALRARLYNNETALETIEEDLKDAVSRKNALDVEEKSTNRARRVLEEDALRFEAAKDRLRNEAIALRKDRLELQREKGGTLQEKRDRRKTLDEVDELIAGKKKEETDLLEALEESRSVLLKRIDADKRKRTPVEKEIEGYQKARTEAERARRETELLIGSQPKQDYDFNPVRWDLKQGRRNRDGYDPKSMFHRLDPTANSLTARAMRRIWQQELDRAADRIMQNVNFGGASRGAAPRHYKGQPLGPEGIKEAIDKAKYNYAIADDLRAIARDSADAHLAHSAMSLSESLAALTGSASGQSLAHSAILGGAYRYGRRFGHPSMAGNYRRLSELESVRNGSVNKMLKNAKSFATGEASRPGKFIPTAAKVTQMLAVGKPKREDLEGRQAAVLDISNQLAEYKANPQDFADKLSVSLIDLEDVSPDVASSFAETRIRGLELLSEKAKALQPKERFNKLQPEVFAKTELHPAAVSKFERYVGAVADFANQFFGELQAGVLSSETVEVGTIVYPEILDEIRIAIAESLGTSDKVMPRWKAASIAKLYAGGITPDQSPDFLRRQVSVYAVESQENGQKSKTLAGIRQPKKRASARNSMIETASQRVSSSLG